jgi:gluconokinase
VDATGSVIAIAQHYYSTEQPQPGWAEQQPESIWKAFCAALQDIVSKCGKFPEAAVLSSAMHSVLMADENGRPLAPALIWSDTRSAAIAQALKNTPEGIRIYQATGTPVHAMSPLCKIAWLRQHQPLLFRAARRFISVKEYIWNKLFGVFEIDDAMASATGLFDILQLRWYAPALSFCGIGEERLSQPVRIHHRRSTSFSGPEGLKFPGGIPFIIGASDGCLANIGSFATQKETAAVTIGTSGAVRICTAGPITAPESMLFNYRLDKQTFVCGGPVSNGGNVLAWTLQHFLQIGKPVPEDYERLFARIEKIPAGSDGLLFLPYLHGERAPVWDASASACFFGIRHEHTQDHFLRAAIEGVCYALCHILHFLEKASGPVEQLNVSGGFIHSRTWMQVLADVTGKRLCLIQEEDASAAGAALLGMKLLGWKDPSEQWLAGSRFLHPDPQRHALYDKYFEVYQGLYAVLKNSMEQLHALTAHPEQ